MTALLAIDNLQVRYGHIEALKGISMHVDAGEVVALVGANGAGKTTLMRTISGLLRPAAGDLKFKGASLLHTGAEFLAGSTRMTAGTAQKIALNLLSTQLMIELGRVYLGFMVNVVPSNAKLEARSRRIVQAIAGCDPDAAAAAWEQAGRDIRLAVLLLDGLDHATAAARLAAARGDLRRARPGHSTDR